MVLMLRSRSLATQQARFAFTPGITWPRGSWHSCPPGGLLLVAKGWMMLSSPEEGSNHTHLEQILVTVQHHTLHSIPHNRMPIIIAPPTTNTQQTLVGDNHNRNKQHNTWTLPNKQIKYNTIKPVKTWLLRHSPTGNTTPQKKMKSWLCEQCLTRTVWWWWSVPLKYGYTPQICTTYVHACLWKAAHRTISVLRRMKLLVTALHDYISCDSWYLCICVYIIHTVALV